MDIVRENFPDNSLWRLTLESDKKEPSILRNQAALHRAFFSFFQFSLYISS